MLPINKKQGNGNSYGNDGFFYENTTLRVLIGLYVYVTLHRLPISIPPGIDLQLNLSFNTKNP